MPTLDSTRRNAARQLFYLYEFLRDDRFSYFGNDADYAMEYDEDGDDVLLGPYVNAGVTIGMPHGSCSNISKYYQFEDDFTDLDAVDNEGRWVVDNTNGTAVLTDADGGVVRFAVVGANNDYVNLTLASAAAPAGFAFGMGAVNTSKLWFEARVRANGHTACGCMLGLGQGANLLEAIADDGTAQIDDGVYFRILEASGTEWDFAVSQNNTETEVDGAIVANADDWHRLGFYYDGVTTVTPYVDDTAGTSHETDGLNFPDDERLTPFFCLKAGAAAWTLDVDYVFAVQLR